MESKTSGDLSTDRPKIHDINGRLEYSLRGLLRDGRKADRASVFDISVRAVWKPKRGASRPRTAARCVLKVVRVIMPDQLIQI
jgi:hypothetical protein